MPLSKPARNAFHENEHPRMKETTSWACSVTFRLCAFIAWLTWDVGLTQCRGVLQPLPILAFLEVSVPLRMGPA